MSSFRRQSNQKKQRLHAMLATIAVLCGFSYLAVVNRRSPDQGRSVPETAVVSVDRLIRTIPCEGEICTRQPAVVYNDCRYWERKIIDILPEGTVVRKGDVVCTLDATELAEKLKEQQIAIIGVRAKLENARNKEALQESENARFLAASRLQEQLSRDRLQAYREAEHINQVNELSGALKLSEEQFALDHDDYIHTRSMAATGYQHLAALENSRTKVQRSARSVELARGEVRLLNRFTHPRTLLQMEADSDEARREVHRTRLQNNLYLSVAQITTLNLMKHESRLKEYINYLERSIAACTMKAPKDGEVVYCHKREEGRFIEVGKKVHYMQNVFVIADRSRLAVKGRIKHVHVYEAQVGAAVEVRVPTLPDQVFRGRLAWIASIPTHGQWYMPEDLHHKVQIVFDEQPDVLKSLALSSSVEAEVVVDDRPVAVQVPKRAVFHFEGQHAVIVCEPEGLMTRAVQIGLENAINVEAIDGLIGGEEVLIDHRQALAERAKNLKAAER